LLAEVEYTEITPDGLIRHPSFKGLREDKDASEVRLEG
jgi:bifunctional non-homologous end joining protein LigD